MSGNSHLHAIDTPALLVDVAVVKRNVARMALRIAALGCVLRPHVKTHKSIDMARIVSDAGHARGITVSTLAEAEYFFAAGHCDILYAVGLTAGKVAALARLIRRGCGLTAITDNLAMARLIAQAADREGIVLPLLIELDVDGHRSGIDPDSRDLIELATFIASAPSLGLAGVMTHAGASYAAQNREELAFHARREVASSVRAADRLRNAGLDCKTISIGSTPTASAYESLAGITEVRAGVYVLHDLVQVGLGVADPSDIAISVLATVIGHQAAKGWMITDAGWMAMSRDRGTADQAVDYGYGQVRSETGESYHGLAVVSANQEHGIIAAMPGFAPVDVTAFPVGTRLRIMPNHACATAGQFSRFEALMDDGRIECWARLQGR